MAGCRYYTIRTYLHTFSILRASSVYPLYIPVRSPVSERGLPAGRAALQLSARAVQGPGDSAGAPGAEQQPRFVMALRMLRRRCGPRCVWVVSSLLFIHIFDGPGPEKRPQIGRFVYGHIDFEKRYTAFREIMCITFGICRSHTQNRLVVSSYPSAGWHFCV